MIPRLRQVTRSRRKCPECLCIPPSWHTCVIAPTPEHISRESLQQKLESGADVVLVDALSPMSYATSHLPGAINLPPESVDGRAQRRIPDRSTEVIVYCSDVTCDSSVVVAKRLIELGYENVRHYAEGKNDWVAAGLPLEGGRAKPS
jgi:rhodanese-related sulfurtransferase